MKKIYTSLFAIMFALNAMADSGDGFRTTDDILYGTRDNTECATAVFANALAANAGAVSETDDEQTIQQWIYDVFGRPDVLTAVLECPEIQALSDDDTIRFMPIEYNFPNGRKITINYETQPKIFKQRINIATKRNLDALNTPSPQIGATDDASLWTNTDPAWYGIMVTEHGALSEFVGPDKNNTISVKWINDNIDRLYPRGATCTSKSALANDSYMINRATTKTVGIGKDDTNDYYVAGDVDLQWISYTEIALDVVITVATMGGGTIITGLTKSARASRAFKNLSRIVRNLNYPEKLARMQRYKKLEKEIEVLRKGHDAVTLAKKEKELEAITQTLRRVDKITDMSHIDDEIKALETVTQAVQDYVKLETRLAKSQQTIERIKNIQELERELDNITDAAKRSEKLAEIARAKQQLTNIDKIGMTAKQSERLAQIEKREAKILELQSKNPSAREAKKLRQELTSIRQERNQIFNAVEKSTDYAGTLRDLEKEVGELEKTMSEAAKNSKEVSEYARAKDAMREISEATRAYRNLKNAKAGNIATRVLKAALQTTKGNKAIQRGAKIARSSMKSGRVRDWLFQNTLRHIGTLGRLETNLGALYGVLKFAGDMYDWTETSNSEFTNGVEFKPLLLLSADDIQGQENVINYGMWLMWAGDATTPADDDAAYLQAFDFAEKFHTDLVETMDENHNHACNVDIYVVRPILRNPDKENPEMYYLIMNDQPWSTAQ